MHIPVKLFLITSLLLLFSHVSTGQSSNLVIFSENGERFSVVLNGVLQNSSPETNIKVTGLPAPTYKLRIIFENPELPKVDRNLTLSRDLEVTYCIKKNSKNQYVLRFQNQVKLSQALPPARSQLIIPYSVNPGPSHQLAMQNQTTTTTVNNVNISGSTVNINVTSEVNASQSEERHEHYVMPGYNGRVGCPNPLTPLDFEKVKQTISDKSFEDSKLQIAKQVTTSNCLFASEVKEIMELFSFEKSRLDFAKFAYKFTYDIGNYYTINDAFHFESSIKELNDYIEGKVKE